MFILICLFSRYILMKFFIKFFIKAHIRKKPFIVIQVIFPNIITYLDRTFKEEQNGINFKIQ
jgi:hypothetical protein